MYCYKSLTSQICSTILNLDGIENSWPCTCSLVYTESPFSGLWEKFKNNTRKRGEVKE